MRQSLRRRLLFSFALLTLAAVGSMTLVSAIVASRAAAERIEARLVAVGAFIAEANFPLNAAVLRQVHALSGAELTAVNSSGRVLASTAAEIPAGESLPPTAGSWPVDRLLEVELQGGEYLALGARPRNVSAPLAMVYVLYPRSSLWRERWRASAPSLIVGAVVLVVALALARSIAHQIARPIKELELQLKQLAHQPFVELPLPDRDDEIRSLAEAVNHLVRELVVREQAVKRSERLSLVGRLSGGLTHQLRNALAGIRLSAQLHRRSCSTADDCLDVVERQSELAEDQLKRLLTAGQVPALERRPTPVATLLEGVLALVRPMARHRGVDLRAGAVSPPDAVVSVDRDQLHQALLNLMINALEAAGEQGWVEISANLTHESLLVRVRDSGDGPPESIAGRLFEPFATTKPEGIGLGLAMARRVAEAHAGGLEWAAGRPTCFELRVSCSAAETFGSKAASSDSH